MKLTKKLLSMLIALIMVFTLAIPVFAAGEGSITIENAEIGQTYTIYKILNLESYNADKNNYAYTIADDWDEFVNNNATEYLKVEDGYVTWITDENAATVEAFAKLAKKYAEDNGIAPSVEAETATSATVSFTGLDLGYYLVDTTLGALCSLNTTKPNVTMREKNEVPEIKKEVQEDSKVDEEGKGWGETNDADIGQTVNFKATVTVQKGAENYVVHDTMSAGLTYTGVPTVKVNGEDVAAANYEVKTTETCGCTFEVAFTNEYIATLEAGTEIVIEYSAKLNEGAVVGLPGNDNKVQLQYGDNNTVESTTTTYTWDAEVVKYTKDGEKEVKLAGAKFKLSTDEDGENVLKFHELATANEYEHCADASCTEEDHVREITTDVTGTFTIKGLDADTYYLTETAAPAGYNQLQDPVKVEITGATKGDDDQLTYTTLETKVLNKSGTELPSTGGIGTTLFYLGGGAMFLGALVVLVTKKRMKD